MQHEIQNETDVLTSRMNDLVVNDENINDVNNDDESSREKKNVETNSIEHDENMYVVMHKASSCFFSVSSEIDYNNYDYGDNDSEMSYYDIGIDDVSFDLSIIKNKSNIVDDDMNESKESSSNDDNCLLEKSKESKLAVDGKKEKNNYFTKPISSKIHPSSKKQKRKQEQYIRSWNAVDVLCHDIMMHVLSFLPTSSIAAFSETARRPNFECFYFLQLQLEHASLWKQFQEAQIPMGNNDSFWNYQHQLSSNNTNVIHDMTPMQSSSVIARLALLSPTKARHLLEEYLQSNSSLHYNMSGSHRLAYFRHALYLEIQKKRKQLPHLPNLPRHLHLPDPSSMPFSLSKQLASISTEQKNKAAAAAAVLMTVVGGAYASYVGVIGSDHLNNNNIAAGQALLSVGLGAFMNMKKKVFFHENNVNTDENENVENSHNSYHHPTQYETIHEHENEEDEMKETHDEDEDEDEDEENEYDQEIYEMEHPRTPNPYDHIASSKDDISKSQMNIKTNSKDTNKSTTESTHAQSTKIKSSVKKPSGCVGVYYSILHKAKQEVKNIVLQSRQSIFTSLSEADKALYTSSFIDCCSSDQNLQTIQQLVHHRGLPVDTFFVTHDGSFTCALHTAAFHGANDILEFLCKGIHLHPSSSSKTNAINELDGGLATIDIQDDNGWTAVHFAAGANNVKGVQILHKYSAKLGLEANNGYTPYRWAERLSNQEVQHELEKLGADKRFLDFKMFGMDISAESLVASYFLGHIG